MKDKLINSLFLEHEFRKRTLIKQPDAFTYATPVEASMEKVRIKFATVICRFKFPSNGIFNLR